MPTWTASQNDEAVLLPVSWTAGAVAGADALILFMSLAPPCGTACEVLWLSTSSWVGRGGLWQPPWPSSNSCLWWNLWDKNVSANMSYVCSMKKDIWRCYYGLEVSRGSCLKFRLIPLLIEDLLKFGVLCRLQSWWWRQRANSSQVLNQLNMLTWSIWTPFSLTVEPLCFETVIMTIIHHK